MCFKITETNLENISTVLLSEKRDKLKPSNTEWFLEFKD